MLLLIFCCMPTLKDRSHSASSVDSFSATDELANLEQRLQLKLTAPSATLSFYSMN